jgi:hypothetical protein
VIELCIVSDTTQTHPHPQKNNKTKNKELKTNRPQDLGEGEGESEYTNLEKIEKLIPFYTPNPYNRFHVLP